MKEWVNRIGLMALGVLVALAMGADPWQTFTPSPQSPSRTMGNPTLSDATAEPNGVCKAFFVEAAGNLSVVTAAGDTHVMSLLAGQEVSLQVLRFNSSNTNIAAADINLYLQ